MNYSSLSHGDGFSVSNTLSSNVLNSAQLERKAEAPSVFGNVSQQIPQDSFGSKSQYNLNTSEQQKFVFGAQPTFTQTETGLHVFGSMRTSSNVFGQRESHFGKDAFSPTMDFRKTLFGQTFSSHGMQNVTTSCQSITTWSNTVFGENSKNTFGSFENIQKNVTSSGFSISSSHPPLSSLTNSSVLSSSHIFGVHSNPSNSNNFTEVSPSTNMKFSQPLSARGRFHAGGRGEGTNLSTRSENEKGLKQNLLRKTVAITKAMGLNKIEVLNIPDHMFHKSSLFKHFSKFGEVLRIATRAFKGCNAAIVVFESLESAKMATDKGCVIDGSSEPLVINLKVGMVQRPLDEAIISRKGQTSFKTESLNKESSNRTMKEMGNSITNSYKNLPEEYAAGGDDGNGAIDLLRPRQVERPSSPQLSLKHSEEQTLKSLLSTSALNSDERFKILEQRDKIIRCSMQKSSDLTTSEVTKGTCMDMCPEKERYMRECRRRLSIFEMVPGTDLPGQNPLVDHARAVKEYSRSSADQEMPLPSELRPPHVLNMTMNYLLLCIMDKGCIGLWAEWYDFLWNRMRGIRKDITQQMLCDVTSVELVEKSARFHILCSELLCEEDPGVFDQKINSENLTKCLQTLKELYHDLYVKQGIVCQNEAEFRSYMVLMNINNAGDILREAQQWRPEVRQSKAFKNSMRAYSSVTSNNYIKFFKLVKQASYLDSCILHRYFSQVRSVAVTRIARAFNSPASAYVISYPFRDLINHLGFESSEEAAAFLGQFGLVVSNGQITSENKQGRVAEPEGITVALKRSTRLVGSKVKTSLGEIVNGGPLSAPKAHIFQDSFNERGCLVLDETDSPIMNCPQILTEHKDLTQSSFVQDFQTPIKTKLNLAEKVVCDILNCIIREVTGGMTREMSEAMIEDSHRFLLLADLSGEAILREAVEECVRECSVEVVSQLKREEEIINQITNQEAVTIFDEVVQSEVQNLCLDSLSTAWSADMEKRMDNAAALLACELVNEVTKSEANSCCQLYYSSNVKNVLNGIKELQAGEQKRLLRRMWKDWLTATKQRQIDRLFPSTVNLHQSSVEVFQTLFPRSKSADVPDFLPLDGCFGVSLLGTDEVVARQEEVKVNLKRERLNMTERDEFCWAPLGVFEMTKNIICKNLRNCQGSKIFWKLLISIPSNGCILGYKKNVFNKWLAQKFKMEDESNSSENEDLCLHCTQSVMIPKMEDYTSPCYTSLCVCIRSISDIQYGSHLLGTSSILFFLRDNSDDINDCQLLKMEAERLLYLLKSKPIKPGVSLVVVGSSKGRDWTKSFIIERLKLRNHLMEELIESFDVVVLDGMSIYDVETSQQLELIIKWLIQKSPEPLPLQTQTVLDFFEEKLNQFFITPMLSNLKRRKELSLGDLPFYHLVNFYNKVARWLIQVATSSQLNFVSWPPGEYSSLCKDMPSPVWNTKENLNYLEKYLTKLILLPELTNIRDLHAVNIHLFVSEYVKLVTKESSSSWKLITKINNLFERKESEVGSRKRSMSRRKSAGVLEISQTLLPQTSMILACIDFILLELLDVKDSFDGRPLYITYFKNAVTEVDAPSLDLPANIIYGDKENKSFTLELSRNDQLNDTNADDSDCLSSSEIDSLFDKLDSEKKASKSFQRFLDNILADKDFESRYNDNKRAKLNEDSSAVSNDSCQASSHIALQDINYLNFKIEQEKLASELLDLKTKLLL